VKQGIDSANRLTAVDYVAKRLGLRQSKTLREAISGFAEGSPGT